MFYFFFLTSKLFDRECKFKRTSIVHNIFDLLTLRKRIDTYSFHSSFIFISMKGTIASLALLALELTLCLISSRWRLIEVKDSQICFKNILTRYNTSSTHHQYLHVGPLYSSRIPKTDAIPEHFSSIHTKTEIALFITGISLIVISAITLASIEFFTKKSGFYRYHIWLHLLNVILLTLSLILLIVGFYSLQHVLKQPLNGIGALGFFIGILFIVMLATHSAIIFWTHTRDMHTKEIEKVVT